MQGSNDANTNTSARDSEQDRWRVRDQRGLGGATSTHRPDRLPPAPRERRPMLAALAVLLIVGGAAGAGLLTLRSDERVPVLVAAHDVAAGEAITATALTSASVASEDTLLIPTSQTAAVVGEDARGVVGVKGVGLEDQARELDERAQEYIDITSDLVGLVPGTKAFKTITGDSFKTFNSYLVGQAMSAGKDAATAQWVV